MFLLKLKTYVKESIKLKKNHPDRFDILNLIKFFPLWLKKTNKKYSPLKDERPWITFSAFNFLEKVLTSDMSVYEYGMGGSTLFFAKRVREIVSVEHDKQWFIHVQETIKNKGYCNWRGYLLEPNIMTENTNINPSDPDSYTSQDSRFNGKNFTDYALHIDQYPDEYFDIIVIDGRARPSCFKHSLKKVKKGGFIVLDNSERDYYYFINKSLDNNNWFKKEFYGPGPYGENFWQTSFWNKNLNQL